MAKSQKANAAPQKKISSPSSKANLLTGILMLLAGIAFTITGIGAIIGIPLFLVGFVFTGFFLLKFRREAAPKNHF